MGKSGQIVKYGSPDSSGTFGYGGLIPNSVLAIRFARYLSMRPCRWERVRNVDSAFETVG
jgi:hypothetical protein